MSLTGARLLVATARSGLYECEVTDCRGTLRRLSEDAVDLAHTFRGHGVVPDGRALYWAAVGTGSERRIMKLAR